MRAPGRALATGPAGRHLALLACYVTVGIAVTWPRVTYLVAGKLQATRDAGVYVWDFWWMAHAVEHLTNPWYTRSIVAPAGVQLGYHALMPLEGVLMMPVTVLFGPSASYNLLSILTPGLMCYAAYRLARLWLPTQSRRGLRRCVLRAVLRHGLACLVPAQPGGRGGVPAAGA